MLSLAVLLSTVCLAEASVGRACVADTECDTGECCVQILHNRGKRISVTGGCQQLGTQSVNKQCYMENRFHYNGMYANHCPCAQGYTCVSTGVMNLPYGMMGTCKRLVKREIPCESGSDCGPHECCKFRYRLQRKRQESVGYCSPMGTSASSCLVISGSGKPEKVSYSCPCETGLDCHANGHFDIPLGKLGNCL